MSSMVIDVAALISELRWSELCFEMYGIRQLVVTF
jgi:hypothetical protein